jgi:hypothetical protein
MVGRAELSEVDAGSNLDDIGILDDSSFESDTDRRNVREASPIGNGILQADNGVEFEV